MAFDKRKALQNALTYTQQGKWDRAIGEYQSILRADPRDVTVYNNLGDLYARAGKTAEAIEQYLKLGELYRADGLSVKAIAVYKKIAKLDAARTEAYLACADLYWEQGLVGEAKIQMATVVEHYAKAGDAAKLIEAYKRLVQFDPTNSSVVVRLADALLREGKREAAAAEYERASQSAHATGQVAEAKRLLQRARELSPRAPEATVATAERLLAEGKTSDALDVLRTLTSAEPGNAKAWRLLGEVTAAQGRAGDGLAALERAVSLGVAETEVARPLGRALVQAGRVEDAVGLCSRLTTGEPDVGIAVCRDLLEVAPQVTALHALLARTLEGLKRATEACDALRALAANQEATGETPEAVTTYRRLLALDPSDAAARARLEALEPPPEPVPSLADVPVVEVQELPSVSAQADAPDQPRSSVDELELALGAEDAALLLEESQAGPSTIVPELDVVAPEAGLGGGGGGGGTASESTDWLTRELHAFDLEEGVSEVRAEPSDLEWAPRKGVRDAEDVAPSERTFDLTPDVSSQAPSESSSLETVPVVELPDVPGDALDEQSSFIDVPAIELPDEPAGPDISPLDLPPPARAGVTVGPVEDDARSGHVAEQLAEADVYQKYGLEEKARERLLEVVRLAPDNLTARRRLKAIYAGRSQFDMAGDESAAIAHVLRAHGDEDAALAEIRDGLGLVPTHKDLQQLLLAAAPGGGAATVEPQPIFQPSPIPQDEAAPASGDAGLGAAIPPVGVSKGLDGAPPPDVPLLFDWDQPAPVLEVGQEGAGGPDRADGEALPKELQALLEGSEEPEPVVVVDETDARHDQVMADDVAEAEFYLSQGMTEEARAVHRRMQLRNPQDPAVIALAEQIEQASAMARSSDLAPLAVLEPEPLPAPPAGDTIASATGEARAEEVIAEFTVADPTPEVTPAGFVDLGAELTHELDSGDRVASSDTGGPLVDGLIKELQKGVREQLDEKDYETHYNLGIAYKEMELYDEAIQEFRLTAREPKRALECADLVGLCYLAKGQPEQAVQDLQAGLAITGHPPDAYHNLRYDLGGAFEAQGDLARALEQFEILQAEGARFLDVQTRLQTLRTQLARTSPPAATEEKPRRKKKISFI